MTSGHRDCPFLRFRNPRARGGRTPKQRPLPRRGSGRAEHRRHCVHRPAALDHRRRPGPWWGDPQVRQQADGHDRVTGLPLRNRDSRRGCKRIGVPVRSVVLEASIRRVGSRSVTEHKSRATADTSGVPVRPRISSMPIARAPWLSCERRHSRSPRTAAVSDCLQRACNHRCPDVADSGFGLAGGLGPVSGSARYFDSKATRIVLLSVGGRRPVLRSRWMVGVAGRLEGRRSTP